MYLNRRNQIQPVLRILPVAMRSVFDFSTRRRVDTLHNLLMSTLFFLTLNHKYLH